MKKSHRGNPYHDARGRFCSANGASTYSELSEREYERRTERRFALKKQSGYDMKSTEGVKRYLSDAFKANGFKSVSVMTDEGWVTVNPYCYSSEPSEEMVEYYDISGPMPWMGSDSLEGASKQIANISADMKDYKKSRAELSLFYEKHLSGVTGEDRAFAWQVTDKLYEDWSHGGEGTIDDYLEIHADEYAEHFGVSRETIEKAWELQCNLSTYSDWHKDIYGHRPR